MLPPNRQADREEEFQLKYLCNATILALAKSRLRHVHFNVFLYHQISLVDRPEVIKAPNFGMDPSRIWDQNHIRKKQCNLKKQHKITIVTRKSLFLGLLYGQSIVYKWKINPITPPPPHTHTHTPKKKQTKKKHKKPPILHFMSS